MALTESTMMKLETNAPDFSLPDVVTGKPVCRNDFEGKPLLVAFWCNHCPFVKHLADAFVEFAKEYQERGLHIVAICANDVNTHPADAPDKMAEEAKARGYTFPYLHDASQDVAKAYSAACTPDFFLFDRDHKLYYRGQFDSTRPDKGTPTGEDLRAACDALLSGQGAPKKQFPSIGCNIKWTPGSEPSYSS